MTCPRCGCTNQPAAKACARCGAALAAPLGAPAEAGTMDVVPLDEPEADRPVPAARRRLRPRLLIPATLVAAGGIVLVGWLQLAGKAGDADAAAALADARRAFAQGEMAAARGGFSRAAGDPQLRVEAEAGLLAAMLSGDDLRRRRAERLLDEVLAGWPQEVAARAAADRALGMLARSDEPSQRIAMGLLVRLRDRRAIGPLLGVYLPEKDLTDYGRDRWREPSSRPATPIGAEALLALGRIDPAWADTAAARACVPRFIAALDGESEWLALAGLGLLGDRRAIGPLVRRLAHKDEGIRLAAAEVLSKIDPNWPETPAAYEAVPVWLAGAQDEQQVTAVAGAVARMKTPRAVGPLVEALRPWPIGGPARGAILAALEASDTRWRSSRVAVTAGESCLAAVIDTTPAKQRHLGAIRVLAAVRRRDAVVPILRAVTRPNRGDLIDEGLAALDEIAPDWAAAPDALGELDGLIRQLDLKISSSPITAIIRAIGRFHRQEAFAALVRTELRFSPWVTEAAEAALGAWGKHWRQSEAAEKLLADCLRQLEGDEPDDSRLRLAQRAVVQMLGVLHSPRAMSRLMELRRDAGRHGDRRGEAEVVLLRLYMEDPRLVFACLVYPSAIVRKEAETTLSGFGGRQWRTNRELTGKADADLLDALTDDAAEVRAAAANWLGAFGVAEAIEPLARALGDSAADVRTAAAEALGNLDRAAVRAAVRQQAADEASPACAAAKELLKRLTAP